MSQEAPPFHRDIAKPEGAAGASPLIFTTTRSRSPVLIVEDHPLYADALTVTLEMRLGIETVRRAGSLGAAMALIDEGLDPGTVLLDLNLPDVTGLDGLARLRAAAPDAVLVVVSSFVEPRIAASALRLGADGVLGKDAPRDVLAEGLQRIWRGERVAPEGTEAAMAEASGAGAGDPPDDADAARRLASLTPQQARILELVCQGMLNKQIAFELEIAETTVKAHISAILRKLGVQSRTQAVLAAQRARFEPAGAPVGAGAGAGG